MLNEFFSAFPVRTFDSFLTGSLLDSDTEDDLFSISLPETWVLERENLIKIFIDVAVFSVCGLIYWMLIRESQPEFRNPVQINRDPPQASQARRVSQAVSQVLPSAPPSSAKQLKPDLKPKQTHQVSNSLAGNPASNLPANPPGGASILPSAPSFRFLGDSETEIEKPTDASSNSTTSSNSQKIDSGSSFGSSPSASSPPPPYHESDIESYLKKSEIKKPDSTPANSATQPSAPAQELVQGDNSSKSEIKKPDGTPAKSATQPSASVQESVPEDDSSKSEIKKTDGAPAKAASKPSAPAQEKNDSTNSETKNSDGAPAKAAVDSPTSSSQPKANSSKAYRSQRDSSDSDCEWEDELRLSKFESRLSNRINILGDNTKVTTIGDINVGNGGFVSIF